MTPFLPGDSLLFAIGALAAVDRSGSLTIGWAFVLLAAAAVAGNSVNYAIGRMLGQRAFERPLSILQARATCGAPRAIFAATAA